MRPPAANATLALLLEVAATPTPGAVDRDHDQPDLRFEHFLAGAVGARPGLQAAAEGAGVGPAFERAVAGMAEQSGGNTQFGALLLLAPLVAAASEGEPTRERARTVVEDTTVDDAAAFYRAFEHVDVAVADPPASAAPDVRRGAEAVPAVESRRLTLRHVMEASADRDGVAREWVGGFERTFDAADRLGAREGSVLDRGARVFLELLAGEPDTHVATTCGERAARAATERAAAALAGEADPSALAEEFHAAGISPGTTADITAGALFVALERGLVV